MNACVRNLLRHMSGLPVVRRQRSIFTNCPFARAWWREYWVSTIQQYTKELDAPASPAALREVLRYNQTYWEKLVTIIISRGAVFGPVEVLAAFMDSLARHCQVQPHTPLRNANALQKVLQQFSNLAAARELGVLSLADLRTEVDDLLTAVVPHL